MTRSLLVALLVTAFVAGCTPATGINEPSAATAATPAVGVTPAIDAARSAVSRQLQAGRFVLTETSGYEPGEPGSVQGVARAIFQLNLAGPNEGWVVIYDVGTSDAALQAGADFAEYLRSFGHSNYPGDSQFTLNAVGSALIFSWWSAQRSPDPEQAAKAFTLISSVGQPIEVIH